MGATDKSRAEGLAESGRKKPAAEREAFLEGLGETDPALRAEVERLLETEPDASPESTPTGPTLISPARETGGHAYPGTRVGRYRLLEEIGHGGMGTVHLAVRDDDTYKKRVAVKLLKKGMDSDDIVRRFRNERQILAAVEHSYIAKLYDGGTTDEGEPKLLDFGIAKLLNPELASATMDPTRFQAHLMTPAYASPEQVRGDPVTTATDVYSLGMILYELLTGHRPYQVSTQSLPELTRIVCEVEPTRPSQVIGRPGEVTKPDGASRTLDPRAISLARAESRPRTRSSRAGGSAARRGPRTTGTGSPPSSLASRGAGERRKATGSKAWVLS